MLRGERILNFTVKSQFNYSFDKVADEVQKVRLFKYTSYPLLTFSPVNSEDQNREYWPGSPLPINLYIFSVVPFGRQNIDSRIVTKTKELLHIEDNGSGNNIKKWDHTILVKRNGEVCEYIDSVGIQAGLLTPFVWLFSWCLFNYRHYRWKKLIKTNFEY